MPKKGVTHARRSGADSHLSQGRTRLDDHVGTETGLRTGSGNSLGTTVKPNGWIMDPPAPFHPTATRRPPKNTVRVGVGVLVVDDATGFVYAGIRRSSHGAGQLALPGGHLELFETWEECARREVHEETGITTLRDVVWGHATNDMMPDEDKHYVTLFMLARTDEVPVNCEPHKCDGWDRYRWNDLVEIESRSERRGGHADRDDDICVPLFGPLRQLIRDDPRRVREYLDNKVQSVVQAPTASSASDA